MYTLILIGVYSGRLGTSKQEGWAMIKSTDVLTKKIAGNKFRMIGVTDDVTVCDCCGRHNLKKTIVLTDSEDVFPDSAEVYFYGQDCAQTALRFKKYYTKKQMFEKAAIAAAEQKNKEQNNLIDGRKVVLIDGRYCLPNQTCLEYKVRRANLVKTYPCFFDSAIDEV